ncbi:hypothetical protein JCGZ_01646 [Jatropha curcas]|uniref:Uncharacterized protein n=1 Tax=Jatropha curcas TaxID=180498 RepID=A0A067JGK4_JATCU|nr:hypothetical protein JCGZ_01646 [Jatropha curcas]
MHTCRTPFNSEFFVIIDPSRETTSRAWNRSPGQRLVRISPIPEFIPISSVSYSSSSDSEPDSDSVEMADDIGDELGFSQAQIRTIAQIVAAALAQDRAQNQATPASSSQPVVEERQIPDPVSDNQTSMGNTTPVENDVLKQLAELKERFDKMAASGGSVNTIGSGLPEEVVLAEVEWEEWMCAMLNIWDDCSSDEEEKMPVKIEIEKSITVKLVDGTEFMVCMTQASTESEWSKKISEFEDFLGIGDEASKIVQEQKAKARIL